MDRKSPAVVFFVESSLQDFGFLSNSFNNHRSADFCKRLWYIFLAICELTIDGSEAYRWVKYFYIDDPISSLDDNNAIAVASDLAQLLKKGKDRFRTVISTHHGLFFNVMFHELKSTSHKSYFLHHGNNTNSYKLQATDDTPFFEILSIPVDEKSAPSPLSCCRLI